MLIRKGVVMTIHTEEEKRTVVRQHIQDARTIDSLAAEYGVCTATISNWVAKYREECQTNKEAKDGYDLMLELRKVRQENAELEKENKFLKKAAAFFAKEIG